MICSASSFLALTVVLASPRTDSVPAILVDRIRAEIATRWQVDSAELKLDWGRWVGDSVAAAASYRLTGGNADGWFAVTVMPVGAPPRAVRVRAGMLREVESASHALAVGHKLEANDIVIVTATTWGPPTAAMSRSLIGWEVRRPLHDGDQLVGLAIAPPIVISTGDPVTMTWSQSGVHVERQGVAMQVARLGEPVRIRAGAQEIAALAIAPDTARVVRRP